MTVLPLIWTLPINNKQNTLYAGEKLPSIFSDVRETGVRDWILRKTISGTFCPPRVKDKDVTGKISTLQWADSP